MITRLCISFIGHFTFAAGTKNLIHLCRLSKVVCRHPSLSAHRCLSTLSAGSTADQVTSELRLSNPALLKYVELLLDEHQQVATKLGGGAPDAAGIGRRLAHLNPIAHCFRNIQLKRQEIVELDKLIDDKCSDAEMRALASEDKALCWNLLQDLEENLVQLLTPPEEFDHNAVIVEVTAGVGGLEAMLFAKELFAMYISYVCWKGWDLEVLESQESEMGGIRHGSISASGTGIYTCLKFESGVHRVQRVPQTERSGRIHTSTVTVAILPQPSEPVGEVIQGVSSAIFMPCSHLMIDALDLSVSAMLSIYIDVNVNRGDLEIETKRSRGAGGQHVNKTESAVRIVHVPTGVVVESQEERSQVQNRALAMKKLCAKLYQQQYESQLNARQSSRKIQVGTSGRSEKIRTYNFIQDRVTDHRVGTTFHHLPEFLGGSDLLDRMNKMLLRESQREILLEAIEKYTHN